MKIYVDNDVVEKSKYKDKKKKRNPDNKTQVIQKWAKNSEK
ncbi:hypothetical protein [uncultured Methanobrevibacter sp.]|nr:hypothetical protein [uncultured Methanobrevibacter sp.]